MGKKSHSIYIHTLTECNESNKLHDVLMALCRKNVNENSGTPFLSATRKKKQTEKSHEKKQAEKKCWKYGEKKHNSPSTSTLLYNNLILKLLQKFIWLNLLLFLFMHENCEYNNKNDDDYNYLWTIFAKRSLCFNR